VITMLVSLTTGGFDAMGLNRAAWALVRGAALPAMAVVVRRGWAGEYRRHPCLRVYKLARCLESAGDGRGRQSAAPNQPWARQACREARDNWWVEERRAVCMGASVSNGFPAI